MNDTHANAFEYRAKILIEQRRYSEADDYLRQALSVNPENVTGLYLLAICQSQLDREKKEILDTIHRGLAVNSEFVPLYVHKASVLISDHKWKDALSCVDTALTIDPEDADAFVMQAHAYIGLDRFGDAEDSVRMALALDPDDQRAGNVLATVLRLRNKGIETEDQVDSLLAKDPNDPYTHATAGWAALEKNDLINARFHFLEALRLEPEFEYARSGIVETYKAQSPLYRLYLQYSFQMAKLGGANQTAVIIGLLLVQRFANKMFPGAIGTTITVLYLIFVLWSWVANGVGNLLLMVNSFARHALLREEKLEGIFVGGAVVVGIGSILTSYLFSVPAFLGIGIAILASAFPFACTFSNTHPVGQKLYGALGLSILATGTVGTLFPSTSLMSVTYILFIAVVWMGALRVLRR